MTRTFADGLAILISGLQSQFPDRWVADRLPPQVESDLPAIWINPIPGATRFSPWGEGLPLEDVPAFDVDILAAKSAGWRALYDYADAVRTALLTIYTRDPRVRGVNEDVPLTKRPDWNDRVIRVGGEYSLRIPRQM